MESPRIQYIYTERTVRRGRKRIMVPTWVSVISIIATILLAAYYVVETI